MEKTIKNTVVGLVLAGGLSAANAHISPDVLAGNQESAMILEYMNTLDKDAAAGEAHAKDPKAAMKKFGLTAEEQAALMSGDKKKVADLIGVSADALPAIQVPQSSF